MVKKPDVREDEISELIAVVDAVDQLGSYTSAAAFLGLTPATVSRKYKQAITQKVKNVKEKIRTTEKKTALTIDYIGVKIVTAEDLIASADIDMEVWEEVERSINHWEVAGKINTGQSKETVNGKERLVWNPAKLWKAPLRQIKIRFRKKSDEVRAVEGLLQRLRDNSPVVPKLKTYRAKARSKIRRELEISIMDPHFGMQCYPPSADKAWSLEDCENIAMWAIDGLIKQAESFFPIERIIMPFGNDFLHVDNLDHTTTAGTAQPESLPFHHIYERAEMLSIAMVERMKEVAPVKVLEIPGNHDRQSAFTLARVLKAYFHNDKNVEVDASTSPYKFHHFGCNLIGFEHGHSVSAIRLAALMANEAPDEWAATKGGYREWHLGDQHRKGSSKPSVMEEQGVSIEYLPGLTPPNEWHRTKAFNWQKRGAMGWVWDYDLGPIARVQVNLNSFTGKPSGSPVVKAS